MPRQGTKKKTLSPDDLVLIVIDIQEKLIPTIPAESLKKLHRGLALLATIARDLKIPTIVTEQYPQGLGGTTASIQALLQGCGSKTIAKETFSACGNKDFMSEIKKLKRKTILLVGMETHVCIYLTAKDLIAQGFAVILPQDVCVSHSEDYKLNGIELMREMGASISNAETISFDLLKKSGTPLFKEISSVLKNNS